MDKFTPHIRLFIFRLAAKAIDFFLVCLVHCNFDQAFWTILGIAYLLASDGFFKGQSIGKRIVGLQVEYIDTDQKKNIACPYSQSVVRNLPFGLIVLLSTVPLFGKLFSLLGIIFIAIEIYFMYSDEEGIRIGDIYAKTRVSIQP